MKQNKQAKRYEEAEVVLCFRDGYGSTTTKVSLLIPIKAMRSDTILAHWFMKLGFCYNRHLHQVLFVSSVEVGLSWPDEVRRSGQLRVARLLRPELKFQEEVVKDGVVT